MRAVAAVDSGQVVNPDGLINQIEGAIVQSMSWTLYESVTFDDTRITSIDWQTYPILRFNSVPDSIEVHIINRPGQPFLGSGETGQGPAAASIANAIANATGKRLRNLPLTRKRIKRRDRCVRAATDSSPRCPTPRVRAALRWRIGGPRCRRSNSAAFQNRPSPRPCGPPD